MMIESIGIDPIGIFQQGSVAVGAEAPINTTPPVVSGNLWLGQTLSTTNGVWDDGGSAISGYSYQWKRDSVNIDGATASTYVTVGLDGDADITCEVTATNAGGSTPEVSNILAVKLPTMVFTEGRTSTTLSPSFTTVDFGAAPAAGERRHIIIAAMTNDLVTARTITGVTVGGVSATRVVKGQADGTSFPIAELWIAEVPTGANGTVVVTGAGNRSSIAAYRAMNMISPDPASVGGILQSGSGPAVISPSIGDLIVGATVVGSAGSMTWTGLTEDYDASAGNAHEGSSASLTAASTAALSINSSPLSGRVLAAAAFEGGFGIQDISVLNGAIFVQPDDAKVSVATLQSGIFVKPDDTKLSVATLQSSIFLKPIATDPHISNVKLLVNCDGADGATTATDDSSSAHTLVFVGNAQLDTAQQKFISGSSILLDGTGDGVLINNSADFQFGSGQFTVEGFVRFASVAAEAYMIGLYDTASQRSWALSKGANAGSLATWSFVNSTNGTSTVTPITATGINTVIDKWYHFAVDRDASNVLRLYVDGRMIGSVTFSGTYHPSTGKLSLGCYTASGAVTAGYLNGWLEAMRITKGVARYASNGGFTVPSAEYPRT